METQEQPKTREEILELSLEARTQEVMGYQINIDNYTIALSEISKKERKRMSGLLELHRGFFGRGDDGDAPSSENETVDAVVIPNTSIDDYFEGADM